MGLGCGLYAQTPVKRIRQKVVDSLSNTPDFVCSESIERTERAPGKAPVNLPAVQVAAGVINAKEMYAWPAREEDQLRLRAILSLFAKGGSGSFALYSRALFLTTNASYYGMVSESKEGASRARTDFSMPQTASTYSLNVGGSPVTLGYTGSIWLEPTTLEILRLALLADDPPAGSDIKSVSQSFEFSPVKFGPNTVRLPAEMEFNLQERSGREQRLVTRFSDCRQYGSKRSDLFVESAFGPPAEVDTSKPAAAPAKPNVVPAAVPAPRVEGPLLPAKLELQTVLAEAIDERNTVQGTKLSFVVTRDVKEKGKLIVPKGASIEGRVTRILRQAYPIEISEGLKAYYLVGIRLDTVTAGSNHFQVLANLENLGPWPDARTNSIFFVPFSHDPNRWGTYDEWRTVFIVPKADLGESFLGVVGEFLRLHGHFVMYWTTLEPPA
jgi:hypothetical protein